MTYRELFELYKDGKLDKEQSEKVANDIERHEVISEYLFDSEEIPEFENLSDSIGEENSLNVSGENTFVQTINKSIRRAFIKMGIAVGSVLLVIVMLVMFVLPKFVDAFYYNPTSVVGEKDGLETNQMSLDMAVYTELFLPQHYRDTVIAEENGYGSYDIFIPQNYTMNGRINNVSGKIERGKLELYDANLLTRPTSNAFIPSQIGLDSWYDGVGAAGDDFRGTLQGLDEEEYYTAYVTLSEVKSYSEFAKWSEENEVDAEWCAICLKDEGGYYLSQNGAIGFLYSASCSSLAYDEEKYPYLSQFDLSLTSDDFDKPYDESVMTEHMTSILRYMNEQEDFCKMMGTTFEAEELESMAENIEKNGLNIYGFTVTAKKSDIIKLSETDGVHYIYSSYLN